MDWQTLRAEIAAAIGEAPEAIPRPSTPEFFALTGRLQPSHPEIAQKIHAHLAGSVHAEPLPSEAEIAAEARRARARRGLLSWATKPDPTQPSRRRTNKTALLAAALVGIFALWAAGKMHPSRPAPPSVVAQRPATELRGRQSSQSSYRGSPSSSRSQRDFSPKMTPPPPPLPPPPRGFSNLSALTPMPGAGADASATGVIIVAPARGEIPGVQIVAPAGEPGGPVGAVGAATSSPRPAESAQGVTVVSAAASQGTASPPEGPGQQSQQATKASPLQVGDQFTVTLLTPLAVSTAWQSLPAVA